MFRFIYRILGSIFFAVWAIIGLSLIFGGSKVKTQLQKIVETLPQVLQSLDELKEKK